MGRSDCPGRGKTNRPKPRQMNSKLAQNLTKAFSDQGKLAPRRSPQKSKLPQGRSDLLPGAVRPPCPETAPRGKNSNFSSPDLPIHPTDCSETLGELGVPHGHPMAKRSSPKTHRIMRNRKSNLKNTSPRVHPKSTKSKDFSTDLKGGITKKRVSRYSCVNPSPKPQRKLLQNLSTNFQRKGSENHQKGKT